MRQIFIFSGLIFFCIFNGCVSQNYIVSQKNNTYSIDSQVNRDTSIDNMITPYRIKIEGQMGETIAVLDTDLKKEQPESTMGNLVADLMMEYCNQKQIKGDVAVVNYNGLRITSIGKGNLPRGRVFELMPFDNAVVVLNLNQSQVVQFCDAMALKGGWHISKGLYFEILGGKAQNIKINGVALSETSSYKFVMSDYVANGGDNCSFLTALPQENANVLLRDLLLQQIEIRTKRGEHLNPVLDGRCVKKG